MSPTLQEAYKRERIEEPKILKSGAVSLKPSVWYRCYLCMQKFKQKDTRLDHIDPVGPTPGSRLAPPGLDWNQFIDRLFCSSDNLGVVCEPCHDKKTLSDKAAMREDRRGNDIAS